MTMINPQFVITPINEPIPEAATKGTQGNINRPAFYTLATPEGQIYAGSTGAIGTRLTDHKSQLRVGKHGYPELQSTVAKEQPIHVTVEYMPSREAAFDAEQAFIDKNANNTKLLNKSLDARKPNKGIPVSAYQIQRLKETHAGKVMSPESRQKMSDSHKGHEHPPATREALLKANSKPVEIDGTVYPSVKGASKALRMDVLTIRTRARSSDPKFANYSFK